MIQINSEIGYDLERLARFGTGDDLVSHLTEGREREREILERH